MTGVEGAKGWGGKETVMTASNSWPRTPVGRLVWLENRLADWTANAAELGIGDDELAELTSFIANTRTKYDNAVTQRSIATAATKQFRQAAEPMNALGGALIRNIRSRADITGDEDLYALARINPQSPPSPAPAPMMPTNLDRTVNNNGSITVRWKSVNPPGVTGTSFMIYRKFGTATGEGANDVNGYRQIGTVGVKNYTDEHVPAGTPSVYYMIRALRGDKMSGFTDPLVVYLGAAPMDNGDSSLTIAA